MLKLTKEIKYFHFPVQSLHITFILIILNQWIVWSFLLSKYPDRPSIPPPERQMLASARLNLVIEPLPRWDQCDQPTSASGGQLVERSRAEF